MIRIMKPTRAYAGTQAVLRAVRLLKALGPAPGELALADLVRAVGLNKTTTYRLLTALEAEGLVQRGAGGEGYRLGPELLALGSRALGASDLRQAGRGELFALAQATRETASLEVLVGDQALILDEAMGGHLVGTTPSVGTRWPAHATATGKVLLADLREEELGALLAAPLAALTARTITDAAVLRRDLLRVRERGYATNVEELEPGYMAVAVPVRAQGGRVVAALSIGGPRLRLGADRLAEVAKLLPAPALRISERLGFAGDGAGERPAATEIRLAKDTRVGKDIRSEGGRVAARAKGGRR
jgi:DNA-binding IclR family transcriptional regulator